MNETPLGVKVLLSACILGGLGALILSQRSDPPATAPTNVATKVNTPSPAKAFPPKPIPARPARDASTRIVAAHDVIGSCWNSSAPDAFADFRDWSSRYLAASPADRAKLLAEGIALAKTRQAAMAQLIRDDPELALALSVPMVIRQQLPGEIVAQLEERVSGQSTLGLLGSTGTPGDQAERPLFRAASIGGQQYTAYVYGRRSTQTTVPGASIVGVALNGNLAVSESPLRVLEAGELANGRPVDPVCSVSGETTTAPANGPFNVVSPSKIVRSTSKATSSASLVASAAPASNEVASPGNDSTDHVIGADPTAVEYGGSVHILCHANHLAQVEGNLIGNEADNTELAYNGGPGSSNVVGRPTSAWTHGTKKLLIVRVDFSDLPGTPLAYGSSTPIDDAYVVNVINSANGVSNYYAKCSFGLTSIAMSPLVSGVSADAPPVQRMPHPAAYYYAPSDNSTALLADAKAAALAAGYDSSKYDRVGIVFTYLGNLPGSKINYAGLGYVNWFYFWVNGEYDLRVVAHEMGHNYGLQHANLWKVTDGNAISLTAASSSEYGDVFDVMGSGGGFQYDFSHWNKSILQWIPDTNVTVASTSGTYRIYRFDGVQTANLSNSRALKIVKDATRDYWIGYRRGSGNASLNAGAYVLWGYNSNQQGNLLDMTTPGVNPSGVHDEGLAIGTSFYDPVSFLTLKPLSQGGSGTEEYLDLQVLFGARTRQSDLNGDGKSDMLLVNTLTGERALWLMNGTTVTAGLSLGVLSPDWSFSATADFNGDGKSDILLTNTVTGERVIWLMNGNAVATGTSLGVLPLDWKISATGDFNGDGKSDVLLTNTVTGERSIWLMNGNVISGGASLGMLPLAWTFSATGDFNGDGKCDIALTNTATGERAIWLMNGINITSGTSLGILPTVWSIAGTGDFDSDGKSDILLSNTSTGERAIWLMNGPTITTGASVGVLPPVWVISRTGDFNGDNKSDILLTNTVTGERVIWLMNGTKIMTGASLGILSTNWAIGP